MSGEEDWRADPRKRWGLALAASTVLVIGAALVMRFIVGSTSLYTYEIHWFQLVPLAIIGVTFLIQSGWKQDLAKERTKQDDVGPVGRKG